MTTVILLAGTVVSAAIAAVAIVLELRPYSGAHRGSSW